MSPSPPLATLTNPSKYILALAIKASSNCSLTLKSHVELRSAASLTQHCRSTRTARRCVRGYAPTLLAMTVTQLTVLTSHYMYRSLNERQSHLWCMACLLSYSRSNRYIVLIYYCAGTCSHAPHRQLQPYSPMHSMFLLISRTSVTRRRGGMTTCHIETT